MGSDDRSSAITRALARYLRTNPYACDTAVGIAQWWLPLEFEATEFDVLPLLERLASRGLLEKFGTADGRWFYRRVVLDAATDGTLEQMTKESNELH
jgi:hypothetical protein